MDKNIGFELIKTKKYAEDDFTHLFSSKYSMSPEKEKNSLRSSSDAFRDTLPTFTVLT